MSIFASLANAEHTFAAWVEKELAAAVKAEPKIEQTATAILKYAGGALTIAATIEGGAAAGSVVSAAISEAQAGVIAAGSLLYDFGAHPSVASVLTSATTNLSAVLAAGHVTNPASVAAVTRALANTQLLATALEAVPTVAA
jgi:hypothetical protein